MPLNTVINQTPVNNGQKITDVSSTAVQVGFKNLGFLGLKKLKISKSPNFKFFLGF